MPACRICGTRYEPFIHFGDMPVANGFPPPDFRGEEIMANEKDFKKSGGKWLVYVPTVRLA